MVIAMLNRVCRKQIHREVLYKNLLDYVAYELIGSEIGSECGQEAIGSKWRELGLG